MSRISSEDLLKAVSDVYNDTTREADVDLSAAFTAVAELAKAEIEANTQDAQRILIREQNDLQRAHDLALRPGAHGQYN